MTALVFIVPFWAMQIFANLFYKYGASAAPGNRRRWFRGFVLGNLFGALSVLFLMRVFQLMPDNPNLAAVLSASGALIGSQIALAVVYRAPLSRLQWAGVILVILGNLVAAGAAA